MRKITRARIKMLFNQPFFGIIAMKMGVKITEAVPTMAVDGRDMFANPDFTVKMSEEETIGVLCHEVLHIANLHHLRKGDRDHQLWNMACDYVINPIVLGAGMKLPADRLEDRKYDGMSAERVYDELVKEHGKGNPPPGVEWGEVKDGTTKPDGTQMSEAEVKMAESEVKVSVAEAAEAATAQGKLPASIAKMVGDLLKAKVNWRDVLRRFVSATRKSQVTWARPNRRLLAHGIRLPGMLKHGMGPLVVAIDTSGSIYADPALTDQFISEVDSICNEVKPERVHVIFCDSKVRHVEELDDSDMSNAFAHLKAKVKGGGGTDFRPVFDWVADNDIQPTALIYLTDMEGTFPSAGPDYPVMWAKTTEHAAPWGDDVRLSA
jgi:predicted metal-dependent peptidase